MLCCSYRIKLQEEHNSVFKLNFTRYELEQIRQPIEQLICSTHHGCTNETNVTPYNKREKSSSYNESY